jgi:NAD(P)-dependent dehydrogenase (short-subunit alcohol dehydrogenase family)
MPGLVEGKTVIITGAGRGIGREHALEFARQGANVIVNDLGAELDGTGSSTGPAGEVVDAIRAMGRKAIANGEDISDWEGSQRMLKAALDEFGEVDILVNNAGILRDRMIFNMSIEEFDAVVKVHLRGTFCTSQQLATRWREQNKEGKQVFGRIVNTTSPSGLYGNPGQTNYGAAKAGIAAMTIIWGRELARYGDITVNAIAPGARTRMTETITRRPRAEAEEGKFDPGDPGNISPLVVWLASPEAKDVNGRVFNVRGGHISVAEPWHRGPSADQDARWDPQALGPVVRDLLSKARPPVSVMGDTQQQGAGQAAG